MADITGVIKGGKKSILGLSQDYAAVTLGIIKGGHKYIVGSPEPTVPDGKTVTPINDVKIWQKCAGIANPTYTTLSEILADVGILKTLMADENAVDYLVRCKDWCGKALVPTMTNNTTPSGEAIGSSKVAGTDYFMVFDSDDTTSWQCNASENNPAYSWVGYTFTSAKEVYRAKGIGKPGISSTEKIQGSNDGFISDIHDLSNYVVIDSSPNNNFDIQLPSVGKYTSYRMYGRSNSGGTGNEIITLQFYGANICDNQYVMQYIGMFDYAANTLLADSDWLAAITASSYFESVLNAKVPTMTSDSTPSGQCSASSVTTELGITYSPYKAFDGDTATWWSTVGGQGVNSWIKYKFPQAKKIKAFYYLPYDDNYTKTFKVQTSPDDATWTDISDVQTVTSGNGVRIPLNNNAENMYYRVLILTVTTNAGNFRELQFYGRVDV